MKIRLTIILLIFMGHGAWGQKIMTKYYYKFEPNPRGNNLVDYLNLKRLKNNKIASCSVYKTKFRKGKLLEKTTIESRYIYDNSGYPIYWEWYVEGKLAQNRDQKMFPTYKNSKLNSWIDSMEYLSSVFLFKPVNNVSRMDWQGYGPKEPGKGKLISKSLDSANNRLTEKYKYIGHLADTLNFTYDNAGIIVEIQAFTKLGLNIYTKRRVKTPEGFESSVIQKEFYLTQVRKVVYNSLGYQTQEKVDYIDVKNTRKAQKYLNKIKKSSFSKSFEYDKNHTISSIKILHGMTLVSSETYEYDLNQNLLKIEQWRIDGEEQITEFRYTFREH